MRANSPVLEPMCGTGRFLLPLLEEGFNIHGFDASDHMLASLHAKAKAKNLTPTVWKDFAEDLKLPEKYNLFFIPSGSFCLIIDLMAVQTALKNIYEHLSSNGIFLFEVETLPSLPSPGIWCGSVWPKPSGQKIILSQLAILQDSIYNSICKYELMEIGKIIHTEIEELKVRIYNQEQLIEMLKEAGFKQIRTLKAFDSSKPPSNQDEVIIYECRK